MEFQKRKAAALAAMDSPAPDKSPKGTIDAPIIPLLAAINSHPSYFTTSSCSGRISILAQPTASPTAPKKKARGGSWLLVSHDVVSPSSVSALLFPSPAEPARRDVNENMNQSVVFRFEPLIIAVECENLEAAQALVSLAISCGFRESGITGAGKRMIIAIRCSIRMEVPLGDTKKFMVSPEYVEYLVEVANEKMAANRKRTDLFFSKLVENGFPGLGTRVNSQTNGDGEEKSVEAKEFESFGSSVENEVEVLEGELRSDSITDHGSLEASGIDLSVVNIVGEPVERLFLWGHSACALNPEKKIVIFGGFGGIGRHSRRNDVLILDTDSGKLDIVAVEGAPSPRLGHTCSLIGDSLYVIGGRADPVNILNEVWVFNMTKKEWKLLQCSGSFFPPRHRHAAAVVGLKIYVFGGICDDSILSSTYVLDTCTFEWSEIKSHGGQPGARHSHSMDTKDSKLYMFGGYNGERALGDLYSFDVQTGQWSKLKTSGQSPNVRFSHLMFVYSKYIGILGGCPVSERREMFLLDLQSKSWTNIAVKSIQEGLLVRSTINVVGDDLIIIGGGASCYAFGTKFSEPMKIDLLQLISLCKDTESRTFEEKHIEYQMEPKSGAAHYLQSRNDKKVNGFASIDSEFEAQRICENPVVVTPCVLRIEKQYAKLGKDLLKKFGWLDLERKVYSQECGVHICLPVTEKFCTMLEAKKDLTDKFVPVTDLHSLKPSSWQALLRDTSSSAALNLLFSFGATKIVDEVVKLKKNPISPFKAMKEAVASLLNHHGLPAELIEQLPTRWERLGDIIVLPVMSFKDQVWESIGAELWPLVARSLGSQRLARQGQIAQTGTRDSKLKILIGNDGWVDHRENGILYSFDATKCMFSWGNLSEKLRMGNLECKDQVVVDLFAGIGYFVLPFLVRANAKMVYACEWNPHAIEALRRNLHANSVADRCIVLEGDNRLTAPKGVADRVCLGLLPSSECSWVTAVRALRDEGGILHIHGNVKDTEEGLWTNRVVQSISDIAKCEGHCWEVSVDHLERVKWYAPHIRHVVLDVRCKLKKR
ncbi:tRNA wybutosine-synthesizing protein 2/3/4 [Striga asiatica]|uniref:tRNA wybutosine-synthesizing protein 3 n=1 Tax=Striga asiatica TaxID=4170 RepID=A0A5A7QJ83_STRAF|nr:tRNA wybutosine-synthesizing protein 2/3/4 [Striga asiatica]